MWVEKVVTFLELFLSSSWWYPLLISRCENTVEPLSSLTTSFIVGCCVSAGYCLICYTHVHVQAYLALIFLGSKNRWWHPSRWFVNFFDDVLIQRCCISSFIFWHTLNDCRRGGCATSLKSGSTFKSILIPFGFPSASNRSLYSFKISFTLPFSSGCLLSSEIALVTCIIPRSFSLL